jgi:hypothetical protein
MRVRAKAISLSTASNWLFNFALAWAVPPGLSTIAYKTYFMFGTFNLAAFIHIFFMFPETAGRTLEEVEEIFAQGNTFTAWKVDRSVGRRTFEQAMGLRNHLESENPHLGPPVSDFSLLYKSGKGVKVAETNLWQYDGRGTGSITLHDRQATDILEVTSKEAEEKR